MSNDDISTKMMEVEVKFRVSSEDVKRIKSYFSRIEGIKISNEVEKDIYYNHPCRDFAVTDEALRIRETPDGNRVLTFKGKKVDKDTKTREEYETGITDVKGANDILLSLGFRPSGKVKKKREIWKIPISGIVENMIMLPKSNRNKTSSNYGEGFAIVDLSRLSYENIVICFDDVENLGKFIELEIRSTPSHSSMAKNLILYIVDGIGFSMSNTIRKSYLEMIMEK